MLKLSTKKSRWFPVPQDASGETQIEVLHLKPGEVADIEAKTNQIIGRQTGEEDFETEIGFDPRGKTKKLVTKAVIGLKGFQDAKGKELKCTDFTKMEIMKEYEWFAEFVEECRETLAEEAAEEQEEAAKN